MSLADVEKKGRGSVLGHEDCQAAKSKSTGLHATSETRTTETVQSIALYGFRLFACLYCHCPAESKLKGR